MLRKISAFLAFSLLAFSLLAFAAVLQAQDLDELLKKNIDAKGGLEKIKSIKTFQMNATMSMPAMGMEAKVKMYNARPNKMRMEGDMMGQQFVQASDGEKHWWIMPFMGIMSAAEIPGEQAKPIENQADFEGPFIDYKKKGHKIELIGKEDVEGTEAYKLHVTYKNGFETDVFLDAEHYLEIKAVAKISAQGMEIEQTTYFSDYKEVDGFVYAASFKQVNPQMEIQFTINEIKINEEIDPSLFSMPEN